MTEVGRNTMIGLFMVVGLAALAWLMTSFGELPALLGGRTYEIRVVVKGLSGVGEGTPVYLSGVQVGRIKELRFKDPNHLDAGVQVICAIEDEYKIPNTATAMVIPSGLGLGHGEIHLEVVQGEEAPPLASGEEIPGIMGGPFDNIIPETLVATLETTIANIGTFMHELTPVAQDLHGLLKQHEVADVDRTDGDPERLTANLYTVIQRFDLTLKTINETLGDPRVREGWFDTFENVRQMSADGRAAVANIREISESLGDDLRRISAKLEAGIDSANRKIELVAADLRPVLEHSAQLAASLNRIAHAIESGEGSAGRFVRDPRLYESLLLTSERMTELVDTIRRLAAKFELDGEIRLNVPIGPIRHRHAIKVPEESPSGVGGGGPSK